MSAFGPYSEEGTRVHPLEIPQAIIDAFEE